MNVTIDKGKAVSVTGLDHSSVQIAVWDGSDGGTANCVRYAETKPDVQIIFINPAGGTIHAS